MSVILSVGDFVRDNPHSSGTAEARDSKFVCRYRGLGTLIKNAKVSHRGRAGSRDLLLNFGTFSFVFSFTPYIYIRSETENKREGPKIQ